MMHALAMNWGYLLVTAIVFVLIAVVLQIKNVKGVWKGEVFDDHKSLFRRFGLAATFGLLGGVSGFLTVVGVIANFLGK